MASIIDIQMATNAARKRLGDNSISTRVKWGRGQIVGIDYTASGTCDKVRELSDWMPIDCLPQALETLL